MFRERVYVLGNGERARTVVETLRARRDAGMEVVEGESKGPSIGIANTLRPIFAPSAPRSPALIA